LFVIRAPNFLCNIGTLPPERATVPLTQTCPKCGAEIAGQTLGGLCPNCVGALALSADAAPQGSVVASIPLTEKPGDRVGRYKLLEKIGEGGCGLVYMAQQGEPVRRQVALKVVKLGMDTKNVMARFEAERQALALMDHPNIAKVFDAGATDTGRPFFVMELVRGTKITNYCDANQLSTRQRLDLFVQVCQAIQHAHQKGLIHRDIKPSNILVTLCDGVPVPKVIDFGIAKATTDQLLTDKTVFTEFHQFVGTPAYMSPEQAEMSELGVDTRSDIYSLGILLYELLTGKTPFETKRLVGAGLDEIRRIIREEEPPRPSTRLETLNKEEQTTVAKDRRAEAPKLISLVRGDLDWIVMKALEKDRTRRYETANGLAADIQRHLENEPVMARPPSKLYRFGKIVRRNRLAFAAAAAIAAALLIGLGVSTLLLFREKEARQRAQTAATKSQQVIDLLKRMLERAGPSKALGRDARMLQDILDETARSMSLDLTNQPEVEVELCLILATAYHDLGLYKRMEEVSRRSLQLARARFGEENLNVAMSLRHIGDALMHLSEMHLNEMQGEGLVEAEKYSREDVAICTKLLRSPNINLAYAIVHLGNVLTTAGKFGEAERLKREALPMYRVLFGTNDSPQMAKLLMDLSAVLAPQYHRLGEAEDLIRQALTMQKRLLGEPHPEVAKSLNTLGYVLYSRSKFAEAEETLRDCLAMWKKLTTGDRHEVALCLENLVLALWMQEKLPEAEMNLRDALAMRIRLSGNEAPEVMNLFVNLRTLLWTWGKWEDAEVIEREVLQIQRKQFGNEHASVTASLGSLATVLQRQGKLNEAETVCRDALSISKKLADLWNVAWSLENLASVLEEEGRLEEAVASRCEELALTRKLDNETPSEWRMSLAAALAKLTVRLTNEGKFAQAEEINRACLAELQSTPSTDDWWVSGIQGDLGAGLLAQGKLADAEPLLLVAYQGFRRSEYQLPTNAVPRLREAAGRLARLYELTGGAEKVLEWRKREGHAQEAEQTAVEAAARRASGLAHAQQGRFGKATVEFARALELRPGDHEVWHWQAAALVQSGKIEAYRELRRKAVEQFEHTTEPRIAGCIARDYLLLPSDETGLGTAATMADTAVNTATNHPDMPWSQLAKGLSEYRQGSFRSAVDWMQQALSASGLDFQRDAQALLVLAMAQQQLKQTDEARGTLAKAFEIVDTRMERLDPGGILYGWVDWVVVHVLMREAEALIEGNERAPTAP